MSFEFPQEVVRLQKICQRLGWTLILKSASDKKLANGSLLTDQNYFRWKHLSSWPPSPSVVSLETNDDDFDIDEFLEIFLNE